MLISNLANNQIVVTEPNGSRHFKSYNTNVASVENGQMFINKNYWNNGQTATTNKYLGVFLGIGTQKVKVYINSAIESGLITLTETIKRF